jgi:hypothetical protein
VVSGAVLRLERKRGWPWFAFQPFSVEIDGSITERVRGGQTVTLSLAPGEHRIRVRFRAVVWSDPIIATAADGDQLVLTCDTDWRGYPWLALSP